MAVCLPLSLGAALVVRRGVGRSRSEATGRNAPVPTPGVGLCWVGLVVSLWTGVAGLVPPSVPVVVAAGLVVTAGLTRRARPPGSTTLRYGVPAAVGAAVFAVGFLAPLGTLPLPDIGVLGRYTYLATEVVFGAVTLALLMRAGREALRSTALTVAAVYPVAYVWDWYTLTVGVFSIPLRTGLTFAGIPVEEHLFMLVVPGFVLAVRETVVPLSSE